MSALTLIAIQFLSILALLFALSFSVGRLGIWSVGHLAFFTVGQIVLASSTALWHLSLSVAVVLVVLISGGLACAVGMVTLRLERDYFVVLSLALAWCVDAVALILFGARGVTMPPALASLPEGARAAVFLGFPVIVVVAVHIVVTYSPWSAALAATRQEPSLAATLGIPTLTLRIGVFTAASVFAAIIGAAQAVLTGQTDPALGDVMRGILLFCLLVLGGVNSSAGITFAAVLYIALPRFLEYVLTSAEASFYAANVNQVVFALATYFVLRLRLRSPETAVARSTEWLES